MISDGSPDSPYEASLVFNIIPLWQCLVAMFLVEGVGHLQVVINGA